MTFFELKNHLEEYGCSLDHLEDNLYFVTNCISLKTCQVEDLEIYGDDTLCHYFWRLGVPSPYIMRETFDQYLEFLDVVSRIEKQNKA